MAKMTAKKALLTSILSLLVCITMLVGTTFAWFTDSVTSGTNKIIAGNLDVNAYYYAGDKTTAEEIEADTLNWLPVQNSKSVFSQDLWEPGHTEIAYLKIVNEGTLAFKYTVNVSPVNEVGGVNVAGESFKLSNYMAFAVTAPSETYTAYTRDTARAAIDSSVITAAVNGESTSLTAIQSNVSRTDKALLAGKTEYIALIVYMPEEVGNVANYKKGTTAPEIDLGISIYAAQYTKEEDSFGYDYDANANNAGNDVIEYNYFPQVVQSAQLKKAEGDKAAKDGEDANVTEDAVANTITINSAAKVDNVVTNESAASVTISNESIAFEEGSSVATVTLNVVKNDKNVPESVIAVVNKDKQETTNYDVDLKVVGGNFEKDANDKYVELITVSMYIGKGKTGLSLYHNGVEMTGKSSLEAVTLADEYYYDSTSGFVTMKVDHLSPFTAVYDAPVASIGTVAYYSLSEAVNAVAANGTIELLRDITLTEDISINKEFVISLNGNTVDVARLVPYGTNQYKVTKIDEKIYCEEFGVVEVVGVKEYNSFAKALANVPENGTIKLKQDVSSVDGYAINKSFRLDTNGKTFTVESGSNVDNRAFKVIEGTLTVIGGGKIVALGGGTTSSNGFGCYGAFRVEKDGVLDVTDVALENFRPWGLNVKVLGGVATLTDVTITSYYGGGIEVTEEDLGSSSKIGQATLNNCTFTQEGYYDHCSSCVSVSGGSKLTVNSGSYTSEDGYALYVFSSGGEITVNGGTFDGNKDGVAIVAEIDTTTYPGYTGGFRIAGGTFKGDYAIKSPAYMSITGGTYSNSPLNYIDLDKYMLVIDDSKYSHYTVTEKADQAAIAEKLKTNYEVQVYEGGVLYAYKNNGDVYIKDVSKYTGTSFTIPSNVTGLSQASFRGNDTIKTLTFTRQLSSTYKPLDGNSSIEFIDFGNMTIIPNRMFYNAGGLVSVSIPSTIVKIEEGAFQQCPNLEDIAIQGSPVIETQALGYMPKLETVVIEGDSELGDYICRACPSLTSIVLYGSNVTFAKASTMYFTHQESNNNPDNTGITVYVANETVKERFLAAQPSQGGIVINVAAIVSTSAELSQAITDNAWAVYLAKDITVTEDWDDRYGGTTSKPVVINGNGYKLKFTGKVSDAGNYHSVFRFNDKATVKNLTFDLSDVSGNGTWLRAISAKSDLTVDNCTFIGSTNYTNTRAVIIGEGQSAAQVNASVTITNSTFTNWKRGITDNENAKDFKSVEIIGNTFTNANVYVSAYDSIVFNGNVLVNSGVDIRSYSSTATLTVKALGNTLDINEDYDIKGIADNVNAQDGFNVWL